MKINIHLASFNDVIHNPILMQELRELTLGGNSGMNIEMNKFINLAPERKIQAYAAMAYVDTMLGYEMIGWALISKEPARFAFQLQDEFHPEEGVLFEVFVDPAYRRKGIGKALLGFARNFVGNETLCVCPWDSRSNQFYDNCDTIENMKKI